MKTPHANPPTSNLDHSGKHLVFTSHLERLTPYDYNLTIKTSNGADHYSIYQLPSKHFGWSPLGALYPPVAPFLSLKDCINDCLAFLTIGAPTHGAPPYSTPSPKPSLPVNTVPSERGFA